MVKNHIGHISLEGVGYNPRTSSKIKKAKEGESVIEFNENPFINCFMLNAKSQSSGLTLNVASNIFMVEPMANKGFEQQCNQLIYLAVNRVHRK
jgi:E3 ubiquitin-protein ligase SHPRH